MKLITRKATLLVILITSVCSFVVLDYEGRFYGIQSLIFNNNFLPDKSSCETDKYEVFRILDMDGFTIAGPGFRMNGSRNKILVIEEYAINNSDIYIRCKTENGIMEDYCLSTNANDSLAKNQIFQLIPHEKNITWRTHLIQKYKILKVLKTLSLCLLLILFLFFVFKCNKKNCTST